MNELLETIKNIDICPICDKNIEQGEKWHISQSSFWKGYRRVPRECAAKFFESDPEPKQYGLNIIDLLGFGSAIFVLLVLLLILILKFTR